MTSMTYMPSLTRREYEVLSCLGRGMSNLEIARELAIAPSTVKAHVGATFVKLGVSNRTQAAVTFLANENGWSFDAGDGA